ncbi:unnamed protein product, partial [Brenthis ino]
MGALLLIACAIIIIVVLIVGLYQKSTNAICKSKKRLDGKTVIVTGGTSGMGLRTAVDLADRGARVIIACPFSNEGEEALKIIKKETESDNVVFELLDLSSIESVRKFVAIINKREERLDILVNNAGVGAVPEFITDDGMSFIMQVNYFGTVLLTLLLLPLLKKSGTSSEPARIVSISSVLHNIGTINFGKLNDIKHYYPYQIYGNSKLCLVLFSNALVKKLKSSNVVVNCVDPGIVGTGIFYCPGTVFRYILNILFCILSKTPWEGAQTALHVALDKRAGNVTGGFFKNCKQIRARRLAYNEKIAKKLWEQSMRLLKLSDEEVEQCLK